MVQEIIGMSCCVPGNLTLLHRTQIAGTGSDHWSKWPKSLYTFISWYHWFSTDWYTNIITSIKWPLTHSLMNRGLLCKIWKTDPLCLVYQIKEQVFSFCVKTVEWKRWFFFFYKPGLLRHQYWTSKIYKI